MIECEWRCMKEFGSAATTRIRLKSDGLEMNICDFCLEHFNVDEFDIIETDLN